MDNNLPKIELPKPPKMARFTVYLEDELLQRVSAIAENSEISTAQAMVALINAGLQSLTKEGVTDDK